jgi:drug/metabolite transporter (DMT)-like permease
MSSGGLVGLAGAALIVTRGVAGFAAENLAGYLLALGCAVAWATYSVGSRRFGAIPTASVAVFCIFTAILSLFGHLVLERTAWPEGAGGWAVMIALGLGPVGLAFFVWDIGVKRGDIQLLGVASYAAPVLSTTALVAAGKSPATWSLLIATILITIGAVLAARASAARP